MKKYFGEAEKDGVIYHFTTEGAAIIDGFGDEYFRIYAETDHGEKVEIYAPLKNPEGQDDSEMWDWVNFEIFKYED